MAIERQSALRAQFENQRARGAHWSQSENCFSISEMEVELKKELEKIKKNEEEKIKAENSAVKKKSENSKKYNPHRNRRKNYNSDNCSDKNNESEQKLKENVRSYQNKGENVRPRFRRPKNKTFDPGPKTDHDIANDPRSSEKPRNHNYRKFNSRNKDTKTSIVNSATNS